jgi:hypothetical protein
MSEENTDFSDLNNINFHEVEIDVKKKKVDVVVEDDILPDVPISKPKRKRPSRAKPKVIIDNEVFSDDCTPILGKDIIVLQNKITQYKTLYPKELKSFKVKKNASVQELEEYLKEMETIVTCDGVDEFITDSILQIIRMGELITEPTRFDITGCADMLKSNPQFNKLCKLLYIKYKVYSEIPPEFQLIMVIGTTCYFCNSSNRKRKQDV